jgi:hypothetical protein
MKTNFKLIIAIAVLFFSTNVLQAQLSSKELKQISKKANKEAKAKMKEGYYVAPGSLPMEMQLNNAYKKQLEKNDKDEPKYITASGNSVGETQSAAKLQAMDIAKFDLAGSISTNVAGLIEGSRANQQLTPSEAASVQKTVAASKSIIAQELGRVVTLSEMYKNLGKTIQVDIIISYNSDTAYDIAKKVLRKSLEEETKIAHEKLEGLMNFNN